ncbi:MAG: PilZ domain-containing protein [Deltaproteobacteria bacterium]|nr:PilZ domain-containing protein [Deltaproteobacteria bacterium]
MNKEELFFGGQRKEKRITINKEFSSLEDFINEYVANISKSGAFIVSDNPLPKGTKVKLRFTVMLDKIETIEGEGEVVRVVKPGGKHKSGMGIVFTKLTQYSKDLIEQIITRKPSRKAVILNTKK